MKIIEDRDNKVLNAAVKLAEADHFQFITRERVAAEAGVSPATVNNCFGTMPELKRAVLQAAVDRAIIPILVQGLAERHPIVLAAPASLRAKAARSLTA